MPPVIISIMQARSSASTPQTDSCIKPLEEITNPIQENKKNVTLQICDEERKGESGYAGDDESPEYAARLAERRGELFKVVNGERPGKIYFKSRPGIRGLQNYAIVSDEEDIAVQALHRMAGRRPPLAFRSAPRVRILADQHTQVTCSSTCVAQGDRRHPRTYPFNNERKLTMILAVSESPREFVSVVKKRGLMTGIVVKFARDCEGCAGYFGAARAHARVQVTIWHEGYMSRPVKAQGLFDLPFFRSITIEDEVVKHTIDWYIFCFALFKAIYEGDKINIGLFIAMYCGTPSYNYLFGEDSGLWQYMQNAIDTAMRAFTGFGVEAQGRKRDAVAKALTQAKEVSNVAGLLSNSPLWGAILTVACSKIWSRVFGGNGIVQVSQRALVETDSNLDYISRFKYALARVADAFRTGEWMSLFESRSPDVWLTKASMAVSGSQNLLGMGESMCMKGSQKWASPEYWLSLLDSYKDEFNDLEGDRSYALNTYRALVDRMVALNTIVTANEKIAQPPLYILYGGPGLGKSTIIAEMACIALPYELKDIEVSQIGRIAEANTYYKSSDPKQDYWQGFASQMFCVFEDVHVVRKENRFAANITEVCNIYKARLTMASIEDKARAKAAFKCVFATSNSASLTCPEYDLIQVCRRVNGTIKFDPSPEWIQFATERGMDLEEGPFGNTYTIEVGGKVKDAVNYLDCSLEEWQAEGFDPRSHPESWIIYTIYPKSKCSGHSIHLLQGTPIVIKSRTAFLMWFRKTYIATRERREVSLAKLSQNREVCEYGFTLPAHNECCPHPEDTCCRFSKEIVLAQGIPMWWEPHYTPKANENARKRAARREWNFFYSGSVSDFTFKRNSMRPFVWQAGYGLGTVALIDCLLTPSTPNVEAKAMFLTLIAAGVSWVGTVELDYRLRKHCDFDIEMLDKPFMAVGGMYYGSTGVADGVKDFVKQPSLYGALSIGGFATMFAYGARAAWLLTASGVEKAVRLSENTVMHCEDLAKAYATRKVYQYAEKQWKAAQKFVPILTAIGAGIVVAYAGYKVYGSPTEEPVKSQAIVKEDIIQSLRSGELEKLELTRRAVEKVNKDQKANPWHASYAPISVDHIEKEGMDHFHRRIALVQEPAAIMFYSPDGEERGGAKCSAFKLNESYWCLPKHSVLPDVKEYKICIRIGVQDNEVGWYNQALYTYTDIIQFATDLVAVRIMGSPGKGIYDQLLVKDEAPQCDVYRDGALLGPANPSVCSSRPVFVSDKDVFPGKKVDVKVTTEVNPGEMGYCGKLYTAHIRGRPVVLGFHIAAFEKTAIYVPLTRDMVPASVMDAMPSPVLSVAAQAFLSGVKFEAPPVDSQVTQVPGCPISIIGAIGQHGRTDKSKLMKTKIAPLLAAEIPKHFAKPYMGFGGMTEYDNVREFNSPFKHKYAILCDRVYLDADIDLARFVMDGFFRALPKASLRPLTDGEAFAGNGEVYCGAYPLKTSMGPMWKTLGLSPKTKVIEVDRTKEEVEYGVNSDFAAAVASYERQLLNGPVYILTENTPKDEPVSEKKAETYNTRLFSVCCGAFNFVGRKYLLPLMAHCYKYRDITSMMPGINCFAKEYSEVMERMLAFDGQMCCDQNKFDIRHWAWLFRLAADATYEWYVRNGFSHEEATIAKHLVISCVYQIVLNRGVLFLCIYGLASGLWITTFLNCLFNYVLVMCAVYIHCGHIPERFRLITYGDDLRVNLDKVYGFNNLVLAANMQRFGYLITSARKDGVLTPFDEREDITFLKRYCVYHEALGRLVAPIDLASIFRMLCWFLPKEMGEAERAPVVARSAMLEAFLHGPEVFQKFDDLLTRVMDEVGYTWEKPSWDQCVVHFEGEEPVVAQSLRLHVGLSPFGKANRMRLGSYTHFVRDSITNVEKGQVRFRGSSLHSDGIGKRIMTEWRYPKNKSVTELNPTETNVNPQIVEATTNFDMETVESMTRAPNKVANMVNEVGASMPDVLSRPVRISSWTVTSSASPQGVNFFQLWKADPVVYSYLKPYRRLRGKFCMRFDVTGTPFQFGMFLIWAFPQPCYDPNDFGQNKRVAFDGAEPYQAYTVPHVKIDLSKSGSYSLSTPLLAPFGWVEVGPSDTVAVTGAVIWGGYTYVANAGTTSGDPFRPFNINVYAWMEDYEVAVIAQSERVAAFATKAKESIVGAVKATAAAYPPLATALQIARVVDPNTMQAMGFSKPLVTDQSGAVIARYNTDMAASQSSRFFGYRAGTDPNGGVAVTPDGAGFDEDDDNIYKVARKWALISRFDWAPASTSGTRLWWAPAVPTLTTQVGDGSFVPAPVGFVSLPFLMWGGDLELKFTVWCSNFHKGTIRIVHSMEQLSSAPAYNTLPSVIAEIAGTTEVVFPVNWRRTTPFATLELPDRIPGSSSLGGGIYVPNLAQTSNSSCFNGYIYVYVEAPLIASPATVPPCTVTVEMRAGEEYRVARPTNEYIASWNFGYANWRTSAVVSREAAEDLTVEPVVAQSAPYKYAIGEEVSSIRALCKVGAPRIVVDNISTTVIPANNVISQEVVLPAYPKFNTKVFQSAAVDGSGFKTTANTTLSVTVLGNTYTNWFEGAFHAQRGGYRWTVVPLRVSDTNLIQAVGTKWMIPGVQTAGTSTTGTSPNNVAVYGSLGNDLGTPAKLETDANLEVETPAVYYTFWRAAQGGGTTTLDTGLTGTVPGPVMSHQMLSWVNPGNTTQTFGNSFPPVVYYCSAADDYSLYGFAFVPRLYPLSA